MENLGSSVSYVLRRVVAACESPVIIILLILAFIMVVLLGSLIAEYFLEHRAVKVFLPKLVDRLRDTVMGSGEDTRQVIKESGLLLRQKRFLMELTHHEDITDDMRESLAAGLEFQEQARYDSILKVTDLMSKIAPMMGLLGTLIPLGPGIMALAEGDTATLSSALLTAFDTTSLGLMIAAVALIISAIRRRWYRKYMNDFSTALECVLEVESSRHKGLGGTTAGTSAIATAATLAGVSAATSAGTSAATSAAELRRSKIKED